MSQFKDRDWNARFNDLGDEAEGRFERYCVEELGVNFVRFGLNRPPLQMGMLPARIRYTPDYLLSSRFVEVQGLGRDQRFKMKFDKLGALHWWNDIQGSKFHGVDIYVWDSHHQRETIFPLAHLDELIEDAGTKDSFPEGKPFWSVPASAVFA